MTVDDLMSTLDADGCALVEAVTGLLWEVLPEGSIIATQVGGEHVFVARGHARGTLHMMQNPGVTVQQPPGYGGF